MIVDQQEDSLMHICRIGTTSYLIILIAILTTVLAGCDLVTSGSSSAKLVAGPTMPVNIEKEGSYTSLQDVRNDVLNEIKARQKSDAYHFSILTDSYWTFGGFHDGKFMWKEENFRGHWIKFFENFTYEYGFENSTTGRGQYHFRMRDNSLLMLDNDESIQPNELIYQDTGGNIALSGRSAFQMTSNIHMMWEPHAQKPTF